jgi:pyruvate dehydrogenase E2 component (dihydrolipoamide acetyltransferase)
MRIPLTRIQKLIGERMLKSKLAKPSFYIQSRADVTELMAIRGKLSKELGAKITSNAFFIRALALAARKYPIMIGMLNGDNIKVAEAINVGFAVHSPQGLVVPVVKEADKKSLAETAVQDKLLTEKARSNKLTLTDMEGQTIALSNLGVYGIDYFFGIVPPQTSTILGVGNVVNTAVAGYDEGDFKATARKITTLTLAVDGRIINEVYAAEFLSFITGQLQDPRALI